MTTTTTTCHCCSLQHSSCDHWVHSRFQPSETDCWAGWNGSIHAVHQTQQNKKRKKFQWLKVEVVEVVLIFSLKYSSDCAGFYPLLHHQRRYCSRKINLKAQNALMDTTQAQLTHARVRTKSFKNP